MFDRSFNGASFDVHDGPVRCCRAVPRSNDCQTVAAHEASGGKSTERVQLQLHARVWTKTQLHRHARVWTKTQGRGRKLVAIQTVAPALPAADCVDPGIRVFITYVKGTFLGMSESEEASKRR